MIDTCDLNAHLTDSRWRRCRHAHPVILVRLASAAKVRVGRDAAGTDRLGEPLLAFFIRALYSSLSLYWQGLDWHGPSAADAFAAVSALSRILSNSGLGRWAKWSFDTDTRVILMGHSNGGQGAWYMASRWPDRVLAGKCSLYSLSRPRGVHN
jgi:pimeloyl-ACP methyl ester carboxylesterase